MCFFLTIAVPEQHAHQIREVFGRGFETRASANASVTALLPEGYTAHLVTAAMCSCDLYAAQAGEPEDAAERLRHRYERRGWSEAKINRALRQVESHAERMKRPVAGLRSDVLERLETLCRSAGGVAVLVHWYSGEVETERLSPHVQSCDCDELIGQAQSLTEDHLLIARPLH